MLLVVVDQPGVRRRRDDACRAISEVNLARIGVHHRNPSVGLESGKSSQTADRVERVPPQKLHRLIDRPAGSLVLVTVVLTASRQSRKIEIEVSRLSSGPSRPRQDDAPNISNRVIETLDCRTIREQLAKRLLAEPLPKPRGSAPQVIGPGSSSLLEGALETKLHGRQRVCACLNACQQAIERGDIASDGICPKGIGLNKRCSRSDKRVIHTVTRSKVATQKGFDELRDELSEIRMKRMNVLRPLELW